MATGDKLVSLDGLKAVHDYVNGHVAVDQTITWTPGYLNGNGVIVPDDPENPNANGPVYSNIIYCVDTLSCSVTFSQSHEHMMYVCAYEADGTHISRTRVTGMNKTAVSATGTYQAPAGTAYIRIWFRTYGEDYTGDNSILTMLSMTMRTSGIVDMVNETNTDVSGIDTRLTANELVASGAASGVTALNNALAMDEYAASEQNLYEVVFNGASNDSYTLWDADKFITSTKNDGSIVSSDNTNKVRVMEIPITEDAEYIITKTGSTVMRAGSGTSSKPSASTPLYAYYASASTANTLRFHSAIGDTYMYIQLFAASDGTQDITTIVPTVKVYRVSGPSVVSGQMYGTGPIVEMSHRGYNAVGSGAEYPENTIPAFRAAVTQKYSWIEVDVQVTQDNVPVILHDRKINRTARNSDGTALSSDINIDEIDYEDLLDYDFGLYNESWGQTFAGTKIPTLAEALDFARKAGVCVAVELKNNTVNATTLPYILNVIHQYGMEGHVELFSTHKPTARLGAAAVNGWTVGYSVTDPPTATDVKFLSSLKINGNRVIYHCSPTDDSTVQGYIDAIHDAGFEIVFRGHTAEDIANFPPYTHMCISNALHPATVLYNEAMGIE